MKSNFQLYRIGKLQLADYEKEQDNRVKLLEDLIKDNFGEDSKEFASFLILQGQLNY